MSLSTKIAKLRRKKRQSLQEVADAVRVSKAHIWQLEQGTATNPSMDLVTRLADHFGVTVASLVGEDIESSDAPADLQRMFRQAAQLNADERAILDDMVKSLIRRHRKPK